MVGWERVLRGKYWHDEMGGTVELVLSLLCLPLKK